MIFLNFFWKIANQRILLKQINQKKFSENVPVSLQNRPLNLPSITKVMENQNFKYNYLVTLILCLQTFEK